MQNKKYIKKESPTKIIFHLQTADEEFEYLISLLKNVKFFYQNTYSIIIPNHPFFVNMFDNYKLHKLLNKKEAKDIFIKEVYNPRFLKKGLENIVQYLDFVEDAIVRMEKLKQWGFKLFETYIVFLTAYGLAGGYDFKEGIIIQRVNDKEMLYEPPYYNIIHQIIHIGIEESIVQKFNLTHNEKEALVDAICINYFDDIWANGKLQNIGDKNVFNLITKDNIMNLPQIIKKYKTNFKN